MSVLRGKLARHLQAARLNRAPRRDCIWHRCSGPYRQLLIRFNSNPREARRGNHSAGLFRSGGALSARGAIFLSNSFNSSSVSLPSPLRSTPGGAGVIVIFS